PTHRSDGDVATATSPATDGPGKNGADSWLYDVRILDSVPSNPFPIQTTPRPAVTLAGWAERPNVFTTSCVLRSTRTTDLSPVLPTHNAPSATAMGPGWVPA